MKSKTIRILVLGCACAMGIVAGASAQEAVMKLSDPQVFHTMRRPAVRFTHADHGKLDGVTCLTCHHVFVGGKNVLDIKQLKPGDPSLQCASCHKSGAALENAFHDACITCHDKKKAAGKVTGPRTCGECHAWGS